MTEHNYRDLADELGIRGHQSGDQLRAGCPVHGGRDQNFSLHVPSGMYTCHSQCGSGNFYRLVSLVLGVSLTAALDWVAEHDTGVYTAPEPTAPLQAPERPEWLLAYEAATANVLPQWWFDRGFDWTDAKSYEIRWHEEREQLLIPVRWRGELVGTIARNLRSGPKYQNSPGLPKRELLFGLRYPDRAIVLVESPVEVIWLTKHGYEGAALMGLQLSEAQRLLLWRCPGVTLALDNDEPGQEAQHKIVGQLSFTRVDTVVFPPGRKDIGECTAEEIHEMASARTVAI